MSGESSMLFLAAIRALISISLVIDSLEFLYNTKHFNKDGLFSNNIYRKLYGEVNNIVYKLNIAISRSIGYFKGLIIFRLLLVGMINVPGFDRYYSICLIALFLIEILINNRFLFGRDGSDQMDALILLGLAAACILKKDNLEIIGIGFIAFQCCLSYTTSGVAKLISPTWTSGRAIVHILNANSYGMRKVSVFLDRTMVLKKSACLTIIVWECIVVFGVFMPSYILYSLLTIGVVFHLLIAIVMGLNKFFWSWIATYPAIIFCNSLFVFHFYS